MDSLRKILFLSFLAAPVISWGGSKPCDLRMAEFADLPAVQQFEGLEKYDFARGHAGWTAFDFGSPSLLQPNDPIIQRLQRFGNPVALLVANGNDSVPAEMVTGYIYGVNELSSKTVPVREYLETLPNEARRRFMKGKMFGPDGKVFLRTYEIEITSQVPETVVDYSSGYRRILSKRWTRKPPARTIRKVPLTSVISAKFFEAEPWNR